MQLCQQSESCGLRFSLLPTYGKAAGLDTCFSAVSLARSTTCGSVSSVQIGGGKST